MEKTAYIKKMAYDGLKLDALQIVEDTKCCLKVNSVISKAGVYLYDDGWALKPKMELLKAANAIRFAGAKLTLHGHPDTKMVMSQNQIYGGVEKPFFDRDKIRAVLNFDKALTPANIIQTVRDAVAKKAGLDVSIGFYYTHTPTPGMAADVNTGKPRHYDYVMSDILIDHVTVMFDGDKIRGRCTFPNCGIGVDAIMKKIKIRSWDSNVSIYGGKNMKKTKADYGHAQSPEEVKAEFEKCVAERMRDGANAEPPITREQAEAICLASTEPADEPEPASEQLDQEDFESCVATKMEAGLSREEAEAECKKQQTDQEGEEPELTPYQKCVNAKMSDGVSREDAEAECRQEHPSTEEGDQTPEEVEPTPMERCVKNKVEEGMSEEEAKTWCEEELAGEHQETDSLVEQSKTLIRMKRDKDILTRKQTRRNPL